MLQKILGDTAFHIRGYKRLLTSLLRSLIATMLGPNRYNSDFFFPKQKAYSRSTFVSAASLYLLGHALDLHSVALFTAGFSIL